MYSDAMKEVTSKGWDIYPSDGQIHQYNGIDLSVIPI